MVSSTFVAVLFGVLPLALAAHYDTGNATSAYYPSATNSPSPVQTVSVGKGGLIFTPDTIVAKVGEEITFQFFPKNHSVVQADFNNPCNPAAGLGSIFSGFIPSATPGPSNQTFTITVKDDKPIWLYCAALLPKPHCSAGMVAVINPPKEGPNSLDAFRLLAAKTNTSTAPATPRGDVETTTPSPSATNTGGPILSTGAASSLVVGGGAIGGLMVVFAGLLL
ncbi:Cupredoxin [Melanomma pulvis-pyrius CBS 109.77]|uniref:Cupredoxin n=1 Tax=Melanomma pulvis-pyrius CBS 109.77 TaxID=1314802 RepID=A0A6A6X586_9PLEO|nr:Cupredoxin [Melanomma pulvis-pyrius CBS 109.77]